MSEITEIINELLDPKKCNKLIPLTKDEIIHLAIIDTIIEIYKPKELIVWLRAKMS